MTEKEKKNTAPPSPTSEEQPITQGECPCTKESCKALQEELEASKDRYIRLYAELENYKKHMLKERMQWGDLAAKRVFLGLIPALNDFLRALETTPAPANESFFQGLQLARHKFLKALEEQGLMLLPVAQGSEFDPTHHQALSTVDTSEESLKGKVVQVVAHGYQLHGKTIYPAQVVIGK